MISQIYKDECIVNFLLKESKMLEENNSLHRSKEQILPQFKLGKTFVLLPFNMMMVIELINIIYFFRRDR